VEHEAVVTTACPVLEIDINTVTVADLTFESTSGTRYKHTYTGSLRWAQRVYIMFILDFSSACVYV
jgi:hypothetical protein